MTSDHALMRAWLVIALAAAGVLASAAFEFAAPRGLGAAQAATPRGFGSATAAAAARLLVAADEYGLTLSRRRLIAGPAIIQLVNRGEDDHDLRIRRIVRVGRRPGRAMKLEVAAPGQLVEGAVRLKPARYRLWCSLAGHRKLGMRALLRVSRAR